VEKKLKNLNLMAPINQLGYGHVGLGIAKSLSDKCNLSLSPIGGIELTSEKDVDIIRTAVSNSKLLDFDAPCIRIWHQHDMSTFMGRGERIGFPIFELDSFTDVERHHLESLDRIFVASQWAKDVICKTINTSGIHVNVIPFGQNVRLNKAKFNSIEKGAPTKFFTCGKWEIRKGHDMLIGAFNKAFEDKDNVELHMMCDNPFLDQVDTKRWKNRYIESKLGHKVRFISRVKSHEEVMSIMDDMDCGVFISRAEGWNLELLEMICRGKPVIATNYSGHTEFCNKNNALLVEIDSLVPAFDGIWFDGKGGNWANLGEKQIDQVVEYMRAVHKQRFINDFGFSETRNKFTWNNTATEILKYV